jgi:O-antigen/teichoic acid export membrane protein
MSALQRLFKNTVALLATNFLRLGVGLVLTIYIARDLGPAFLGKYTLLVAYINIFQILAEAGIPRLVTREVARSTQAASRHFWNALVVQLACSLLATGLMIAVVEMLGYPADTKLMLYLATGSLPAYAILAAGTAVLQAHERMEINTLAETVSSAGQLAATIVVLRAGYGVVGLALVKVLGFALIAVVNVLAVWRLRLVGRPQLDLRFGLGLLWQARTILLMAAVSAVLIRLDVLIITQIWGEAVTGVYNAAYQLVKALVLLVWAYADAVYPVLSRLYKENTARLRWALSESLSYGLLAILPVAVGASFLASPVIRLVYRDESFVDAAWALRLLVWQLLPFFAHTLLGRVLVASDRQDIAGRIEGLVLVAAVVYEVTLIYFLGMIGASVAASLIFLTALTMSWRAVTRLVGRPKLLWRQMAAACLAALGLAAGLWLLRDISPWLQVIIGGMIYAGLALGLGAVRVSELRALTYGLDSRLPFD